MDVSQGKERGENMKIRILSLAMMLAVASVLGCEGAAYVETEPPPLQVEVRSDPPGPEALWIDGYWRWGGHQFFWIAGHWERHPHGNWVAPRWEKREHGYFFIKGHWDGGTRDRGDRRNDNGHRR